MLHPECQYFFICLLFFFCQGIFNEISLRMYSGRGVKCSSNEVGLTDKMCIVYLAVLHGNSPYSQILMLSFLPHPAFFFCIIHCSCIVSKFTVSVINNLCTFKYINLVVCLLVCKLSDWIYLSLASIHIITVPKYLNLHMFNVHFLLQSYISLILFLQRQIFSFNKHFDIKDLQSNLYILYKFISNIPLILLMIPVALISYCVSNCFYEMVKILFSLNLHDLLYNVSFAY